VTYLYQLFIYLLLGTFQPGILKKCADEDSKQWTPPLKDTPSYFRKKPSP